MRNKRILAVLGSLLLVGMTVTAVAQNQQTSSEREGSTRQVTEQAQHANQQGQKADKGKRVGPGDGSGQKENPPKDGTGYGANSGKANGPQDGSGNKNGSGNKDGSGMQRGGQHQGGAQPGTSGSRGRGKGRGRN